MNSIMDYYFPRGSEKYSSRVKIKISSILGTYFGLIAILIISYIAYPDIPEWITKTSFFILFVAGIVVIPLAWTFFKPHRCKMCNHIVDSPICDECAAVKRKNFLESNNTFTCILCKNTLDDYKMFLIHFELNHNAGIGLSVHEGYEAIIHVPEESVLENKN